MDIGNLPSVLDLSLHTNRTVRWPELWIGRLNSKIYYTRKYRSPTASHTSSHLIRKTGGTMYPISHQGYHKHSGNNLEIVKLVESLGNFRTSRNSQTSPNLRNEDHDESSRTIFSTFPFLTPFFMDQSNSSRRSMAKLPHWNGIDAIIFIWARKKNILVSIVRKTTSCHELGENMTDRYKKGNRLTG